MYNAERPTFRGRLHSVVKTRKSTRDRTLDSVRSFVRFIEGWTILVHQYKMGGYNIVIDVNSGAIHVVDDMTYDMIEMYESSDKDMHFCRDGKTLPGSQG